MRIFKKGHKEDENKEIENKEINEITVESDVEENVEQNTEETVEIQIEEIDESESEADELTESEEVTESATEESEEPTKSEPEETETPVEQEKSDEEKSLEELDQEVEEEVRNTTLLAVDEVNKALADDQGSTDNDTVKTNKWKRICKIIGKSVGGFLGVVLLVYLVGTVYFHFNFFYNTTINGTDVSFKSVQAVHITLTEKVENYTLTLHTADDTQEVISGSHINIGYRVSEDVATALDLQMAYKWPVMFFKNRQFNMDIEITFNEDILVDTVNNMDFATPTEVTKPVNAYPTYEEGSVVIVDEIYGNKLNENIGEILINAVNNLEDRIYLAEAKAYVAPDFTAESEEVALAVETMQTFLNAEINYNEGELIDSELIGTWLKVDRETLEVSLDSDMVNEFVKGLESKYNTNSGTVSFTNPVGKKATVTGGSYGYRVNVSSEVEQITTDIKTGTNVSREIKYSQKGTNSASTSNPFGDTYVCLDLTLQKVYMLYKGSVVLTSDVVTGNVSGGMATPQGVYTLTYKTKNAVLRGDIKSDGSYGYESPVSYWMPFNGGIGFHDASWRSTYGGTIYKTNGSHGCVNMPLANAAKLYEYIDSSMPIVCHY